MQKLSKRILLNCLILEAPDQAGPGLEAVVTDLFPLSQSVAVQDVEQARQALEESVYDLVIFTLDPLLPDHEGLLNALTGHATPMPALLVVRPDQEEALHDLIPDVPTNWEIVTSGADTPKLLNYRILKAIEVHKQKWELDHFQHAFHSSLAHYRNVFDELPDLIFFCDRSGCLLDVNASVEQLFGQSRQEMLMRPIFETFGMSRQDFDKLLERALSDDDNIEDFEIEFHPPSGKKVHGLTHLIRWQSTPGRPAQFQGVIRDISPNKEMESQLRQSEDKYRTLDDLARITVSSLNLDEVVDSSLELVHRSCRARGAILLMKGKGEDLELTSAINFPDDLRRTFGQTPPPVIGRDLIGRLAIQAGIHVIEPGEASDLHPVIAQWHQRIGPGALLSVTLGQGNPTLPTTILLMLLPSESTGPEQEELLEGLSKTLEMGMTNCFHYANQQEAENRYRELWENAPAFFISLLKGGVIFAINKTAADALGYEVSELITKSIQQFIVPEDRELFETHHHQLIENGLPQSYELRLIKRDGSRIVVSVNAEPLTDDKLNNIGEKSVLNDITRDKEMQSQLFQSSKLATLGEMAAGIAHEMNQPLSGIRTRAQLVEKLLERTPLDAPRVESSQEEIIQLVDRMTHIIHHMRIFARQDQQRFAPFQLTQSIDGALSLLGEQLRIHAIEITKDIPDGLPLVMGEPLQIEQVILNLLSNARDSMSEKAEVMRAANGDENKPYRKELIMRVSRPDENELCLEVRDNGMGMDDETRSKLFEPFFTTKPQGSGTGLGLSITYGILTSHKGRIVAHSRPGEGALFRVFLPVHVDSRGAEGAEEHAGGPEELVI